VPNWHLKLPHGDRRYLPYAVTEQGIAMLSSVLRSKTAIAVNIEIMRAFVELRRIASSHAALEKRLEQIEGDGRARKVGFRLPEEADDESVTED
jgi:hypothetical protein